MSKGSKMQQDLLARVQAIGAPMAEALRDGRNDDDGDEPSAPIDREIVATSMRRLLALCVDIEEGLYKAELGEA